MADEILMFGKTYRSEDDWSDDGDVKPVRKSQHQKRRFRKVSKKQRLDLLEEHNDGYINEDRPYNSMDDGE